MCRISHENGHAGRFSSQWLRVSGQILYGLAHSSDPAYRAADRPLPSAFAILSGSTRAELLTFSTGRNETGAQVVPRITFAKGAHEARDANQVSCVPPKPQSQRSRGMACVWEK